MHAPDGLMYIHVQSGMDRETGRIDPQGAALAQATLRSGPSLIEIHQSNTCGVTR